MLSRNKVAAQLSHMKLQLEIVVFPPTRELVGWATYIPSLVLLNPNLERSSLGKTLVLMHMCWRWSVMQDSAILFRRHRKMKFVRWESNMTISETCIVSSARTVSSLSNTASGEVGKVTLKAARTCDFDSRIAIRLSKEKVISLAPCPSNDSRSL